ncbi:unnamed protein product [Linum tenue]|uniref:Uncharacterized protein n=1 Tax=Linum tenue TaxID=586396 RepID=A0AAV0LGZ7_9ROSI|nr:unnamed protein product [Linum tenue]
MDQRSPIIIRGWKFEWIITTQAAREISAIFKRSIKGPWITFSKYPASELETVIARFKDSGFTYTGSEETFNDMEMSDTNKGNREKSELAATGGSAPLAKYRHEEIKQTGKEPDSIEMFRRFHVKKDKNWVSSKAKTLHDGMIQAEAEKSGLQQALSGGSNQRKGKNDEKMKKLEDEIVDVRNAVPHIGESVLQRLGVRLPESFDMDLNSEANGEQGRVGETQGNDVADDEADESDEETVEETAADA